MPVSFDLSAILPWLKQSSRPLLIAHRRPDGDALGALSAMSLLLQRMGAHPTVLLFEPLPPRYPFLTWPTPLQVDARPTDWKGADGLVVLDTCSTQQLAPVADLLPSAPRTLVIDHHATYDEIAGRTGDLRLIDPSAGACCLLLHEWLASTELAPDVHAATALFTGIATDSGWFRFSNTDERMLRAASHLAQAGAAPADIHGELYQREPLGRLRLTGRLLSTLELHAAGLLAVMKLRESDFAECGADRSMTEDLVNEASRLEGIEAWVLFTQEPDCIRANLRSRKWLDVAAIASELGGGGHARAAGARLSGDWDAQTRRVIDLVSRRLLAGK